MVERNRKKIIGEKREMRGDEEEGGELRGEKAWRMGQKEGWREERERKQKIGEEKKDEWREKIQTETDK